MLADTAPSVASIATATRIRARVRPMTRPSIRAHAARMRDACRTRATGGLSSVLHAPPPRLHAMDGARFPTANRPAYGPRMRFQVLGPIEVATDEGPLALGGPVQRLVLAHLLVRRGEVVGADVLIDAVWEEQPPASARNTLQSYISRLRGILGA